MGAYDDSIHLVDGFLMLVGQMTQAAKSRCFWKETEHSYCTAKDEAYYGFEAYHIILIGDKGYIDPISLKNSLNNTLIYKHLYQKTWTILVLKSQYCVKL